MDFKNLMKLIGAKAHLGEAEEAAARAARIGEDAASHTNFKLVGEPYGSNYPSSLPMPEENLNLPVSSTERGIVKSGIESGEEAIPQYRDVTGITENPPNMSLNSGQDAKKSLLKQALIAGGIGAGGIGLYSALGGQGNPESNAAPMVSPVVKKQENPDQPVAVPDNTKEKLGMKVKGPINAPPVDINPKSTPMMNIDFGTGYKDTAQSLKDVQDKANMANLINQLGKSGEIIGSSIAGAKPVATDTFNQNIALANQAVPQHEAQMEKDKNDPNSPLSKGMRQFMQSFGFNVKGDASADELMKLSPLAEKYFNAMENRRVKEEDIKEKSLDRRLKREEIAATKETSRNTKQEQLDTKRLDNVNNRITASLANSRSAFGTAARNLQSIGNAEALLNGETDLNSLDNRQVYEISRTLDRILSQGQPTQAGTEHLTPETAKSWLAKKMEYITNQRQGAGAESFLKNFQHNLDREKNQATGQIRSAAGEVLGGMSDLSTHPRMADILYSHQLPPDLFEQKHQGLNKVKELMSKGVSFDDALKQVSQPPAPMKSKSPPSGQVHIKTSDGQELWLPKENLGSAQKRDPGLQVLTNGQ